jgi:hypothetical protein
MLRTITRRIRRPPTAIPLWTEVETIPHSTCRLGALVQSSSNVRCGAHCPEGGRRHLAGTVGVSVGRGSVLTGSRASPASEPWSSTLGARGDTVHISRPNSPPKGREPSESPRRTRSGQAKFGWSTGLTVINHLSAIQGCQMRIRYMMTILTNRHPHRPSGRPTGVLSANLPVASRCAVAMAWRADRRQMDGRRRRSCPPAVSACRAP